MTGSSDVVYSCNICDKSYKIKFSFHSHMRLKHKETLSDVEKGQQASQRKSTSVYTMSVENERAQPLMVTREWDSMLADKSDMNLAVMAAEAEQAAEQVERLEVRDHEVEWYKEDNISLPEMFTSDFASSLRSESLSSRGNRAAELHNNKVQELTKKYDAMVIKTNKLLKASEKVKLDLRKYAKSLEKQLTMERKKTQQSATDVAKYSGEITNLKENLQVEKDLVVALKLKIEDQKKEQECSDTPAPMNKNDNDIDEILEEGPLPEGQRNCEHCNFMTSNRVLLSEHVKKRHGDTENKCLMCGSMFPNRKTFQKHMKKHEEELNKLPRANYPRDVYTFNCNQCQVSFKNNDDIIDHMYKVHLTKAQQQGVGGEKYMTGGDASEDVNRPPKCKNGDQCYFHKQHRCNFFHAFPPQEEQWKTVPHRVQGRRQKQFGGFGGQQQQRQGWQTQGRVGQPQRQGGMQQGRGGQQHGRGGQQHGLGGQQHGRGGQQHGSGGQQHGRGGQQHGNGGQQQDHGGRRQGHGGQQQGRGGQQLNHVGHHQNGHGGHQQQEGHQNIRGGHV